MSDGLRRMTRRLWILSAVFLLSAGALYALSDYVERFTERAAAPLKQGLETVPLELAGSRGQNVEMAPGIVADLGAQDFIKRQYHGPDGTSFTIYVGYFDNLGTMKGHSPEVCYPGAGWDQLQGASKVFADGQGNQVEANILVFGKRGLRQAVVSWFLTWGGPEAQIETVRLASKLKMMMLRRRGIIRVQMSVDLGADGQLPDGFDTVVLSVSRELEKLLPRES